jgi:hypothetical protein
MRERVHAACLIGEDHEPGVEHDGEQDVASGTNCERQDDSPVGSRNLPASGHDACRQNSDSREHQDTQDKSKPEPFDDLGNLDPKVGPFDLLLCRTPCDVVGEHVRENCLSEVDAEATEEKEAVCDESA